MDQSPASSATAEGQNFRGKLAKGRMSVRPPTSLASVDTTPEVEHINAEQGNQGCIIFSYTDVAKW